MPLGWKPPEPKETKELPAFYHCRPLERLPLGTLYAAPIEHLKTLLDTRALKGTSRLVVDGTGVGRPVVDSWPAAPHSTAGRRPGANRLSIR